MMISSELIIGNALLAAVEKGQQELELDYFVDYRERLKNRLADGGHTLAALNVYDILDTAYIVTPYLRFKPAESRNRFRAIEISNEEAAVNALKRKLNVYFKNMTPEWLRNVMSEI